ncbi:MAG: InlB B-repeat-containing protein, partial [Lachnospiraceae bacterium]|nr:InlB B-repeat-containing protein [Lachnospiraceae bacterium]
MKTYFTQSYSDTNTSAIQTIEINNPYTKSTNVRHIGSYHLRLSDLRTLSLKILILLMVILSFQCINSTNTYAKTKKYTITYKLNKGINSPKNPKKYVKGKKTKLYKPSKSGYTFKGWYKDSKYTKKI